MHDLHVVINGFLILALVWYMRRETRAISLLVYYCGLFFYWLVRSGLDHVWPETFPRPILHLDQAMWFLASAFGFPLTLTFLLDSKFSRWVIFASYLGVLFVCIAFYPLGSKFAVVLTTAHVIGAVSSWALVLVAIFGSKRHQPGRIHLVALIALSCDSVISLFGYLNRYDKDLAALSSEFDLVRLTTIMAMTISIVVLALPEKRGRTPASA